MFFRYLLPNLFFLIYTVSASCSSITDGDQYLKFRIGHAKNSSGIWVTTGAVDFQSENVDAEITYDVMKSLKSCGAGNYLLTFSGHVSGSGDSFRKKDIAFHPRRGTNIRLTNGRKTASRINEDLDHGVVYTDRPLRAGEMLTVKLDKTTPKHPWNLGIGITSNTPYENNVPDQHISGQKNMWLYYHCHFYINGTRILEDYGVPMDFDKFFKVGDTVGLVVTPSRELHYFINGEDQGPVANNIPLEVYGVVELRSKTVQVTIVS